LDAYSAYYGLDGEHFLAEDYYWTHEPDSKYPDRGFEMFNLQVGNPHDFTNEEWVGIDVASFGQAEIVIDLKSGRVVRWVGFHLLSMPEVGITFPTQLSIACMSSADLWVELGHWNLPVERQAVTSEYLFSNLEPLEKECRKLKASLWGDDWIFISEIEIVVASTDPYLVREILRIFSNKSLKRIQ
jgi:hypothetical protein